MRAIWKPLSEYEQIGKSFILMQAADGFRQKRRTRQGGDFVCHRPLLHAKRRNAVRYNQSIDRWMKNRLLGAFHEQAMSDESQNALRACPLGGLRGAGQGGARAYQIIDNKGRFALHISDEEIARDDARAAVLLGKGAPDWTLERLLKRLPEQLRPLRTSRVGRDDTKIAGSERPDVLQEDWRRGHRDGAAAERILEG